MKRESKFNKVWKRDEILRNKVSYAGFAAFAISVLFWPIEIVGSYFNSEVNSAMMMYALSFVGKGLVIFLGMLFLLTIAKKEYFNRQTALSTTFLGTAYSGYLLHSENAELWVLLVGLVLVALLLYKATNLIFKGIHDLLELTN